MEVTQTPSLVPDVVRDMDAQEYAMSGLEKRDQQEAEAAAERADKIMVAWLPGGDVLQLSDKEGVDFLLTTQQAIDADLAEHEDSEFLASAIHVKERGYIPRIQLLDADGVELLTV